MVTLRARFLAWIDRFQAAVLVAILAGSALAFGGVVWWWRPILAGLATALVVLGLVRVAIEGKARIRLSPIPMLGVLALAIGVVQLAPLPATIAGTLSPEARSLYARGVLVSRATMDDPEATLPEPVGSRSPATIDRSSTLRWLFDAGIGLVVLITSARFARRLGRTMVIWGSVVAVFSLVTLYGWVQVLGDAPALWGFIRPGRAAMWAPSTLDLMTMPNRLALRPIASPGDSVGPWVVAKPDRPSFLGGLMGGPGAYLALAALAMPLTMTVLLQLLAPRGSREPLRVRIGQGQTGPLVVILGLVVLLGSGLVGAIAGPWLVVPFAVGLVLTGLPAARSSGLRWLSVTLTVVMLTSLGTGVAVNRVLGWERDPALSPISADLDRAKVLWMESAAIVRDFPVLGAGLGTFPRIAPYYKTGDVTSTTAASSVLQWVVESGLAGALVLGLALLWAFIRLPRAWSRVGTADRALASGLIASIIGFGLFATIHWTVELPAVALAACAVVGTLDRWLSGGTDLFVEAA